MNPQEVIDQILRREGAAYTNRPADKGGPTKYGITIDALSDYIGAPATVAQVMGLTEDVARAIYSRDYIERPGFMGINSEPLRALLVDCGVNHGVERAVRWLQESLSGLAVVVDGQLGPKTKAAANAAPARRIFASVLAKRVSFYGAIIAADYRKVKAAGKCPPMQAENAGGWMNRAAEFVLEMGAE